MGEVYPLSQGVEIDAALLSSGTISYLIGSDRYEDIDRAQAEFVVFCRSNKDRFATWKEAWQEWKKGSRCG